MDHKLSGKALVVYNHVSRSCDRFFETGWRRAFGWLGFAVGFYTFIYAPSHQIAVDTGAVNTFLVMVTSTFVARGAEKVLRDRATLSPTGGLVNNEAIA